MSLTELKKKNVFVCYFLSFCAISATIDVLLVGYLRKLACCSLFLLLLLFTTQLKWNLSNPSFYPFLIITRLIIYYPRYKLESHELRLFANLGLFAHQMFDSSYLSNGLKNILKAFLSFPHMCTKYDSCR